MLGLVKELNGSLDGLDVSINGVDTVDIALFSNSLDIFAQSILVLLSLLQLWEKTPLSFKRFVFFTTLFLGPLKLNRGPVRLFGHLRYKQICGTTLFWARYNLKPSVHMVVALYTSHSTLECYHTTKAHYLCHVRVSYNISKYKELEA